MRLVAIYGRSKKSFGASYTELSKAKELPSRQPFSRYFDLLLHTLAISYICPFSLFHMCFAMLLRARASTSQSYDVPRGPVRSVSYEILHKHQKGSYFLSRSRIPQGIDPMDLAVRTLFEDKVEQLVGVMFELIARSDIVKSMGRRSLMLFGVKRLNSQLVRSDLWILENLLNGVNILKRHGFHWSGCVAKTHHATLLPHNLPQIGIRRCLHHTIIHGSEHLPTCDLLDFRHLIHVAIQRIRRPVLQRQCSSYQSLLCQ